MKATKQESLTSLKNANRKLRQENTRLTEELAETRELLNAIQTGAVDAFVIKSDKEPHVFTLESAERPFRTVVETMNEGAATITEEGLILYCNQRFTEILGLSLNDVLGRTMTDFLKEDQVAAFKQMIRQSHAHSLRGELTLRAFGEKDVTVYAAFSPLEDSDMATMCLVVTDISDIKKRNKEALEKALRAGHVVSFEWDRQTDSVTRSENAFDLFEYDATQGTGSEYFSLLHPEDRPELEKTLYSLKPANRQYRRQHRLVLPGGRIKWVEETAEAIFDHYGKLSGLHGLMLDVTERKAAEDALRQSERRYRTLFESMDEGFCVIEVLFDSEQNPVDYIFVEVNPAFERQSGLKDVKGKTMRNLVPKHESYWFSTYGKVALTGEPVRFTNQARELDRWFNVYAFRIGAPQERKVAILFSDISDIKKTESDLLEYKDRLENKNKEMEAIIGIVSHDLRAPLVNIEGFSQEIANDSRDVHKLISTAKLSPEVKEKLDTLLKDSIPQSLKYIQTSAGAMNNLVRSLVEVAKTGLADARPQAIDMNNLLEQIISNLEFKIQESGAEVCIDHLPPCFADTQQVTQIFTNLLDNAIKYLDPARPGRIYVYGRTDDDHATYHVTDNGLGIDPEHQKKVFEMFTRFSAKLVGGEGLGLAMTKRLVDKNNGAISLCSEPGRGSDFSITLPLALTEALSH